MATLELKFNHKEDDIIEACDLANEKEFIQKLIGHLAEEVGLGKSKISESLEMLINEVRQYFEIQKGNTIWKDDILMVYIAFKYGQLLQAIKMKMENGLEMEKLLLELFRDGLKKK